MFSALVSCHMPAIYKGHWNTWLYLVTWSVTLCSWVFCFFRQDLSDLHFGVLIVFYLKRSDFYLKKCSMRYRTNWSGSVIGSRKKDWLYESKLWVEVLTLHYNIYVSIYIMWHMIHTTFTLIGTALALSWPLGECEIFGHVGCWFICI